MSYGKSDFPEEFFFHHPYDETQMILKMIFSPPVPNECYVIAWSWQRVTWLRVRIKIVLTVYRWLCALLLSQFDFPKEKSNFLEIPFLQLVLVEFSAICQQ